LDRTIKGPYSGGSQPGWSVGRSVESCSGRVRKDLTFQLEVIDLTFNFDKEEEEWKEKRETE
jgi:hypothetical protein